MEAVYAAQRHFPGRSLPFLAGTASVPSLVQTAFVVALLATGVVGALVSPGRLPLAAFPVAAALVAVASHAITFTRARSAVGALVEPLVFLLLAVPLAALLDDAGAFDAAARVVSGERVALGCWLLGCAVVAVLNLDAAVVLLTPLYIRVARRLELDATAYAFQPALVACLASCALPVSNLTNLIAVHDRDFGTRDFLGAFALPSVVACAAGYAGWRFAFRSSRLDATAATGPQFVDARPLVIGGAVLAVLLVGFLFGRGVGVEPWMVVAVVDGALVLLTRKVPWRSVPYDAALLAAGLAVLAAAVVVRVDVGRLLAGPDGALALLRDTGVTAVAANVMNNLPAFLVLFPFTAHGPDAQLWAVLLGANLGPVLLVTGSLSGLLWLTVARRDGLDVGPVAYLRVGAIAGLPAFVLAAVTLALVH
jgi:arsenical pump membrane protein